MIENKRTAGAIALDLMQKDFETKDPREQGKAMLKDWDDNFNKCLLSARGSYIYPFYVVVVTKQEKLMPNVLRNYFCSRQSCPTPDYDQTVYQIKEQDEINFLWVIPAKKTCLELLQHRLELDPSLFENLQYVLDYQDGTLHLKAKQLNGETEKPGCALEESK